MESLSNFANTSTLSDVPCGTCSEALTIEVIKSLSGSADLALACEDEYSAGCLGHSRFEQIRESFKACSGITLTDDAAFTCSTEQYNMLSKGGVNTAVFAAIASSNTTTAASVLANVLNKINALETAQNVTFACKNCYSDAVTALFDLPATKIALCKSLGASECLKLADVNKIAAKYAACSGNVLDFETASEPTATTTTTTVAPSEPSEDSKSAGIAPVATLIVAAAAIVVLAKNRASSATATMCAV
jgi:hypothetical protein